jgi:serine/threonine protein kinase
LGTPNYIAPEILLSKGHTKAVDWWTLGIFIYEMIAGIDPFNADDPMVMYTNILESKLKFPVNFDRDAKSLVDHLLQQDVNKRYGNLKRGI